MALLPGVYKAKKKDSSIYYRASITYKNKHISLGSFSDESDANQAYLDAKSILESSRYTIENFQQYGFVLNYSKCISLINFRDNNIYCKNPIYLFKNYFTYYLSENIHLIFDVYDLFYYANHKIMKRGNHLFVHDYGIQTNILSRYGIRNYAVPGRDYIFINGNNYDFRYSNIKIINKYYGVFSFTKYNKTSYLVKIHINGDLIVGIYSSEIEAAVAYNKAGDLLKKQGIKKEFFQNYIWELNSYEYLSIYEKVSIRKNISHYSDKICTTKLAEKK